MSITVCQRFAPAAPVLLACWLRSRSCPLALYLQGPVGGDSGPPVGWLRGMGAVQEQSTPEQVPTQDTLRRRMVLLGLLRFASLHTMGHNFEFHFGTPLWTPLWTLLWTPLWDTTLGHHFGTQLGTQLWTPLRDTTLGHNFGPHFGTPLRDPTLRPYFANTTFRCEQGVRKVGSPRRGPHFGTPLWDPTLDPTQAVAPRT